MTNLSPSLDQKLSDLGDVLNEYTYPKDYHDAMQYLVVLLATAGVTIIGLSFAYGIMNNQWMQLPICIGLSLPFLGGGFLLFQKAKHDKKLRFFVHEHGFVHKTYKQTSIVRWDEVKDFWLQFKKITSRSTQGPLTLTKTFYKISGDLVTEEGSAIKFKHAGGDIENFGHLIEQLNQKIIFERKVPQYEAMLAKGEAVQFNGLTITAEGFAQPKKTLAWEDVDSVNFSLDSFYIEQPGRWGPKVWYHSQLAKIPNAFAIPPLVTPHVTVNDKNAS